LAIPVCGKEKKPGGEVVDWAALAQVASYCIDKSQLSGSDRYLLDGFVKAESKPKHLLTKLPWKMTEGCDTGNPDAIATVEFIPLTALSETERTPIGPQPTITDSRDPDATIKVVLIVTDSARKVIYRAESMPLSTDATPDSGPQGGPVSRQDGMYHVFWALTEDLGSTRGTK
jgi:hypothetical protein